MGIIDTFFTRFGISDSSLGIAFGGGGARGFAHIGLVLALEKYGVKADIVSGVSAGAIAAVMYGCGMSGKEMLDCFSEFTKFSEFREWIVPKTGLMSLDKFGKMLNTWLPVKKLEEMPIPTVVCATDLEKGSSVGFTSGDVVKKVKASCSIPIIFPPIKINGNHYVDGGVLRNLPAWAIRDKCKILIGCNCSPLDHNYNYKASLLSISLRTYFLMTKSNTARDLELCDYVVENSNLSRYSTFDVAYMKKIVLEGYDSACPVIENLLRGEKPANNSLQ